MQLCAQGAPHKQTYALKFKIEGVGCGWVDGVGRESHESITGKREIHASKPSVLYASHSPPLQNFPSLKSRLQKANILLRE